MSNIFEDELPAMFAKLPAGGQYHSRYAWYAAGLKLVAIAGIAWMSDCMPSNTVTVLTCLACACLSWSLGDDLLRLRSYIHECRGRFLSYAVAHDTYTYYGKGWKVMFSWYPKCENITLIRYPGKRDHINLQLVLRPRRPFVLFITETLPF